MATKVVSDFPIAGKPRLIESAVRGIAALALAVLLTVTRAQAGEATEQVKCTTDKIVAALGNPSLQGAANRTQLEAVILQELKERFDWPTICRSCLGHRWGKLSPQQHAEFSEIFERFLERTYLDQIEPVYKELDKITYRGEKVIDTYASVKAVVSTKQKIEHPLEYRLAHSTKGWQVYDVVIEGVSLTANYRSQFAEVLNRSTFASLMEMLRAKMGCPKTGGS